jgi:DNA-binding transcriptional ArsR family regulator
MALVDDLVTTVLLASAAFFVALAFGLLIRYRQVSQKITSSSDLGRDLWQALEQRMKKQDERILDVMARLEVVQSRVLAATAAQTTAAPLPAPVLPREAPPSEGTMLDVTPSPPAEQRPESQPESQTSQMSQGPVREIQLDETQLKVVNLLGESPKNTRQLTDAIGLSREHTARLMKALFEAGVVSRNDATKPFVYQLTDHGRSFLPVSPGGSSS